MENQQQLNQMQNTNQNQGNYVQQHDELPIDYDTQNLHRKCSQLGQDSCEYCRAIKQVYQARIMKEKFRKYIQFFTLTFKNDIPLSKGFSSYIGIYFKCFIGVSLGYLTFGFGRNLNFVKFPNMWIRFITTWLTLVGTVMAFINPSDFYLKYYILILTIFSWMVMGLVLLSQVIYVEYESKNNMKDILQDELKMPRQERSEFYQEILFFSQCETYQKYLQKKRQLSYLNKGKLEKARLNLDYFLESNGLQNFQDIVNQPSHQKQEQMVQYIQNDRQNIKNFESWVQKYQLDVKDGDRVSEDIRNNQEEKNKRNQFATQIGILRLTQFTSHMFQLDFEQQYQAKVYMGSYTTLFFALILISCITNALNNLFFGETFKQDPFFTAVFLTYQFFLIYSVASQILEKYLLNNIYKNFEQQLNQIVAAFEQTLIFLSEQGNENEPAIQIVGKHYLQFKRMQYEYKQQCKDHCERLLYKYRTSAFQNEFPVNQNKYTPEYFQQQQKKNEEAFGRSSIKFKIPGKQLRSLTHTLTLKNRSKTFQSQKQVVKNLEDETNKFSKIAQNYLKELSVKDYVQKNNSTQKSEFVLPTIQQMKETQLMTSRDFYEKKMKKRQYQQTKSASIIKKSNQFYKTAKIENNPFFQIQFDYLDKVMYKQQEKHKKTYIESKYLEFHDAQTQEEKKLQEYKKKMNFSYGFDLLSKANKISPRRINEDKIQKNKQPKKFEFQTEMKMDTQGNNFIFMEPLSEQEFMDFFTNKENKQIKEKHYFQHICNIVQQFGIKDLNKVFKHKEQLIQIINGDGNWKPIKYCLSNQYCYFNEETKEIRSRNQQLTDYQVKIFNRILEMQKDEQYEIMPALSDKEFEIYLSLKKERYNLQNIFETQFKELFSRCEAVAQMLKIDTDIPKIEKSRKFMLQILQYDQSQLVMVKDKYNKLWKFLNLSNKKYYDTHPNIEKIKKQLHENYKNNYILIPEIDESTYLQFIKGKFIDKDLSDTIEKYIQILGYQSKRELEENKDELWEKISNPREYKPIKLVSTNKIAFLWENKGKIQVYERPPPLNNKYKIVELPKEREIDSYVKGEKVNPFSSFIIKVISGHSSHQFKKMDPQDKKIKLELLLNTIKHPNCQKYKPIVEIRAFRKEQYSVSTLAFINIQNGEIQKYLPSLKELNDQPIDSDKFNYEIQEDEEVKKKKQQKYRPNYHFALSENKTKKFQERIEQKFQQKQVKIYNLNQNEQFENKEILKSQNSREASSTDSDIDYYTNYVYYDVDANLKEIRELNTKFYRVYRAFKPPIPEGRKKKKPKTQTGDEFDFANNNTKFGKQVQFLEDMENNSQLEDFNEDSDEGPLQDDDNVKKDKENMMLTYLQLTKDYDSDSDLDNIESLPVDDMEKVLDSKLQDYQINVKIRAQMQLREMEMQLQKDKQNKKVLLEPLANPIVAFSSKFGEKELMKLFEPCKKLKGPDVELFLSEDKILQVSEDVKSQIRKYFFFFRISSEDHKQVFKPLLAYFIEKSLPDGCKYMKNRIDQQKYFINFKDKTISEYPPCFPTESKYLDGYYTILYPIQGHDILSFVEDPNLNTEKNQEIDRYFKMLDINDKEREQFKNHLVKAFDDPELLKWERIQKLYSQERLYKVKNSDKIVVQMPPTFDQIKDLYKIKELPSTKEIFDYVDNNKFYQLVKLVPLWNKVLPIQKDMYEGFLNLVYKNQNNKWKISMKLWKKEKSFIQETSQGIKTFDQYPADFPGHANYSIQPLIKEIYEIKKFDVEDYKKKQLKIDEMQKDFDNFKQIYKKDPIFFPNIVKIQMVLSEEKFFFCKHTGAVYKNYPLFTQKDQEFYEEYQKQIEFYKYKPFLGKLQYDLKSYMDEKERLALKEKEKEIMMDEAEKKKYQEQKRKEYLEKQKQLKNIEQQTPIINLEFTMQAIQNRLKKQNFSKSTTLLGDGHQFLGNKMGARPSLLKKKTNGPEDFDIQELNSPLKLKKSSLSSIQQKDQQKQKKFSLQTVSEQQENQNKKQKQPQPQKQSQQQQNNNNVIKEEDEIELSKQLNKNESKVKFNLNINEDKNAKMSTSQNFSFINPQKINQEKSLPVKQEVIKEDNKDKLSKDKIQQLTEIFQIFNLETENDKIIFYKTVIEYLFKGDNKFQKRVKKGTQVGFIDEVTQEISVVPYNFPSGKEIDKINLTVSHIQKEDVEKYLQKKLYDYEKNDAINILYESLGITELQDKMDFKEQFIKYIEYDQLKWKRYRWLKTKSMKFRDSEQKKQRETPPNFPNLKTKKQEPIYVKIPEITKEEFISFLNKDPNQPLNIKNRIEKMFKLLRLNSFDERKMFYPDQRVNKDQNVEYFIGLAQILPEQDGYKFQFLDTHLGTFEKEGEDKMLMYLQKQ
ncbi:hypothetical protein PPERSA_01208 [Pseudocohnilembus persalinus]|uniref:Transmembrane protein n=1 Tax=Pseudocohnilembus persalinus TaxID=266149 RepID=A0A0V0QBT9_PSEPJ|nr:hypothetical protein PPERSA_01208 [Pseudocohnilembus persalinus]|eukprot:KRW99599.1 hypothetical protein PPERSA_01208 [Pseudocohnilembus persalinus]